MDPAALPDISTITSILTVVLFYSGWIFTRGPNMQKFYFKLNPANPTFFFGLIPQRSLPGTRIIVSGFWGMSRHINYL
jgi:delta14-sterol reductase